MVSKVWNDSHAPADVARSVRQSLTDLRLDHLDAYLVHWPFPNTTAAASTSTARDPHARPYVHERFMETWRRDGGRSSTRAWSATSARRT